MTRFVRFCVCVCVQATQIRTKGYIWGFLNRNFGEDVTGKVRT